MTQPLPIDESKFKINVRLEGILNTPHHSDVGFFIEVDLYFLYKTREKTKNFLKMDN